MRKLLTRLPLRLTAGAFGFILSGMLVGNMILIYLGVLPIIYVLYALTLKKPSLVQVQEPGEPLSVVVGDEITVTRGVRVEDGLGLVTLGEPIPEHFELVSGNNLMVLWKGMGPLEREFSYTVRCTRRGVYDLEQVMWETRHPMGMTPTQTGVAPIDQTLTVRPKPFHIKRVRQHKLLSVIPMPAESQIKIGVPTTDFKEIRAYSFGDSYKQINWKASARLNTGRGSPPAVNEYEREGRRVVWILLNSSRRMALGTSINNSFENAVQAILGLSEYYLSRQCMVGFSLFNDTVGLHPTPIKPLGDAPTTIGPQGDQVQASTLTEEAGFEASTGDGREMMLFPDTGRLQQYKLYRMLIASETTESGYDLKESIRRVRGHIRGTNPLFIIVTNIQEDTVDQIMEGIKELGKYTKRARARRPNIIVLHISGYSLAAKRKTEEIASGLLEFEEGVLLRPFRRMGITTLNWNPSRQTIGEVLLTQVGRR